jgi:putative sterol carrier protein
VADKYEFLSDEWMRAAREIRDTLPAPTTPMAHKVRMNLVITEAPVNDTRQVKAHMDTTDGNLKLDEGHLDGPDLTLTVDYDTAKAIFVDQNPAAGMQAFMAGKVKVDGDMSKLLAMQAGAPDPSALEATKRIQEITA